MKDMNESKVIYFPHKQDLIDYVIPKNRPVTEICEQGLPIPPQELWLDYGKTK